MVDVRVLGLNLLEIKCQLFDIGFNQTGLHKLIEVLTDTHA